MYLIQITNFILSRSFTHTHILTREYQDTGRNFLGAIEESATLLNNKYGISIKANILQFLIPYKNTIYMIKKQDIFFYIYIMDI